MRTVEDIKVDMAVERSKIEDARYKYKKKEITIDKLEKIESKHSKRLEYLRQIEGISIW
jgi:hypothetical protein